MGHSAPLHCEQPVASVPPCGAQAGPTAVPLDPSEAQAGPSPTVRIVEFGCGSGNLVLPLAFLMPCCIFHAIDAKPAAVGLLLRRIAEAGLSNVTASIGRIEEYQGGRQGGLRGGW